MNLSVSVVPRSQNTGCCQKIAAWFERHPTVLKIVKIFALILSFGILAVLPCTSRYFRSQSSQTPNPLVPPGMDSERRSLRSWIRSPAVVRNPTPAVRTPVILPNTAAAARSSTAAHNPPPAVRNSVMLPNTAPVVPNPAVLINQTLAAPNPALLPNPPVCASAVAQNLTPAAQNPLMLPNPNLQVCGSSLASNPSLAVSQPENPIAEWVTRPSRLSNDPTKPAYNEYKLNLEGIQGDLSQDAFEKALEERINALSKNFDLGKITVIYLANNKLERLPPVLQRFPNLNLLDVNYNQLSDFPDWIAKFTKIDALFAAGNRLSKLSDSVLSLHGLTCLFLNENQIAEMPDLSGLNRLEELHIASNWLEKLPEGWNVASVTLDASQNPIKSLPGYKNTPESLDPLIDSLVSNLEKNPIYTLSLGGNRIPQDQKDALYMRLLHRKIFNYSNQIQRIFRK